MLKVAFAALTPRVYGQAAFLGAILPRLAQLSDTQFFVLTSQAPPAAHCGNLRFVHCRLPPRLRPGWARVLWEQAALPRLIAQLGVDVCYSPNNIAVLASPRPCVIHVRNMEPLTTPAPGTPPSLRARLVLLRFLSRRSLITARRVIAACNLVSQTVIALGCPRDRVKVIYHGVDHLEPWTPAAGRVRGYIGAAAKFVRYANLATLIRGFAQARELGYGGELRIAGGSHDRRYEAEIRALAGSLAAAASAVRFLGYLEHGDVLNLMRQCEVFVFPSTLEACPFTMLEAMRQGAPLIATTAPPMPEFGADAPIYVPPHDFVALGQAIHQVTSCPPHQLSMSRRSARRAHDFRWDHTVSQLGEVLSQAACAS